MRLLRRVWPQLPGSWSEFKQISAPALVEIARFSAATVLAFLLTRLLIPGPVDLTGALAALLIIQASANGTLKMAALRVTAVLMGVGLALAMSVVVGLHWYSLFAVVFLGLLLSRIFNLGDQVLETPISAMLILGATSADVAAGARVLNTLIGTGVGVIFPFIFPPQVPLRRASQTVADVGRAVRYTIDQIASELAAGPITKADTSRWMSAARDLTTSLGAANKAVESLHDLRRWNVTSLEQADAVPLLRGGLDVLEHSLMALRSLLYTLSRELPADAPTSETEAEVRTAFATTLSKLGAALESYADLLQSEAQSPQASEEAYEQAVDELLDARAVLTELLMIGAGDETWLLRPTILASLDQIVLLLDRESQRSEYDAWKASQLGYKLLTGTIGPRIRGPRARARQRKLRASAKDARERYGDQLHTFEDDDTTTLVQVVPPKPRDLGPKNGAD